MGASTFGFTVRNHIPSHPSSPNYALPISTVTASRPDHPSNNSRSKITCSNKQTGKTNIPAPRFAVKPEAHELPPDARSASIPSLGENESPPLSLPTSTVITPGLAYYGEPKRAGRPIHQAARLELAQTWASDDGHSLRSLISGDLNGDGRHRPAASSRKYPYWFPQEKIIARRADKIPYPVR